MADRCEFFKTAAEGLKQVSSVLPFPGNLAVESASRLVLVITAFMQLKTVEQEEIELADRLAQRTVEISNLIESNQRELKRDVRASSFIERFRTRVNVINLFIESSIASGKRRSRGKKLLHKVAVAFTAGMGKSVRASTEDFEKHSRMLDSLHSDFQSYLMSSEASKGPHVLIKHPDIRIFWKYRLTNQSNTKWEYFWDHFLDEFPKLKENFDTKENKEIFENIANSRSPGVVDPKELDAIFQPVDQGVEMIVLNHLKNHLLSDSSSELTTNIDPNIQGEVQQWTGYWIKESQKCAMNLELFVTYDHQVLGSGEDTAGIFTIEGEELAANINFTMHYVKAGIVNYKGKRVGNNRINGYWSSPLEEEEDEEEEKKDETEEEEEEEEKKDETEEEEEEEEEEKKEETEEEDEDEEDEDEEEEEEEEDHIRGWRRGEFHLEKVASHEEHEDSSLHTDALNWLQQVQCLNMIRYWKGFYEKDHENHKMETSFVFTPSGRIHGKGHDYIGCYTWCGNFSSRKDGTKKVSLTKKYFEEGTVSYNGEIFEPSEGELVMEGTWDKEEGGSGKFRLDVIVTAYNSC